MIIKRSIQCRKCKQFIETYGEENAQLKGLTLTCKCGHKQRCVKHNKHLTKWKDIEEEI